MAEEMTLFETKLALTSEQQANTQVVKKLAPLADYYICDAFAAAHRAQPSLLGFEEVLPSAMGRLFEREYSVLSDIMAEPERPSVFVLGGAKIQDAFVMMTSVLEKNIADYVLTGGLVGNVMLVANGVDIGKSSIDFIKKKNLWEFVRISKEILQKYRKNIILPEDLAYVFDSKRYEVSIDNLPQDDKIFVDIGHKTTDIFKEKISTAKTIFLNGPLGVFEEKESEYGTENVMRAIANAEGFSVIGGGDSITASNKYSLGDKFSYVCTGGGALIRFLSGEELPVVRALKKGSSIGK